MAGSPRQGPERGGQGRLGRMVDLVGSLHGREVRLRAQVGKTTKMTKMKKEASRAKPCSLPAPTLNK